jgi:hypothetical protein
MNDRRVRVVELVGRFGLATARQIQLVEFEPSSQGKLCRRELTELVRNGWLDVLPGRKASEPAIYRVSGKSPNGLNLLKLRWTAEEVKQSRVRPSTPHHLLGINDIRAVVTRACIDLDYSLLLWQTSEDIERTLTPYQLIPDSYFKIQRVVETEIRTHAFFVEFERVVKSHKIVKDKLDRYSRLIFSGDYHTIFQHDKLPRVLFILASSVISSAEQRIKAAVRIADAMDTPIAHFASIDQIKQASPREFFTGTVWHSIRSSEPVALC